ncbi:hypothetical protein K438DRAFT_1784589 [Mycena galopus ATCC 62051]|nr:hypothetical protein K438DRAFT_1784589 [Mycena galopus ATCC 62051]
MSASVLNVVLLPIQMTMDKGYQVQILINGIAFLQITSQCIMLAAWLSLHVGISRKNSGIFLKALQVIMSMTVKMIFNILHQPGLQIASPTIDIPIDIQTVYKKQGIEPEIIYVCEWKKSPGSWYICGTKLKKKTQIEDGLEQAFQQEQTGQNAPSPDIMRDIQDSPAWRGLGNYLLSRYHQILY